MFLNRLSHRMGAMSRATQVVRKMHSPANGEFSQFDRFMRMPTFDSQYVFNGQSMLVRPGFEPKQDVEETIDQESAIVFSNVETSMMMGEIDFVTQFEDLINKNQETLEMTSILRKRRTKMNQHQLKKRRKRERYMTRKNTK